MIVLWGLRAGRNLTAIPFCVSIDTDHDGWFNAPNLYQLEKTKTIQYLVDTLITVHIVWSLGPLHWITLGYVYDGLIFPDNPVYSMVASCVLGYAGVALCSIAQGKIQGMSTQYHKNKRQILKTLLEDIFIYLATASVILCWKGVGMAVDSLAKQFPVIYAGEDYTGLCANLGSFLLLSLCYASGSLVGKGAELDGSMADGAGVDFSRCYFAHFFNDFIEERERTESKKLQ